MNEELWRMCTDIQYVTLTVSAEGFGECWGVGDVVGGVLLGNQCDQWPVCYLDNRDRLTTTLLPHQTHETDHNRP